MPSFNQMTCKVPSRHPQAVSKMEKIITFKLKVNLINLLIFKYLFPEGLTYPTTLFITSKVAWNILNNFPQKEQIILVSTDGNSLDGNSPAS